MKTAISIIRIAILLDLGILAMFLLFCREPQANLLAWTFQFIFNKALGIGAIFLIARLYKRWSKIDPFFIAYDTMCDDAKDKPNPTQL